MSRTTSHKSLNELIPIYYSNKQEMENYKELVDEGNKEIKQLMSEQNMDEFKVSDYTAKITIQHRESMNEVRLLEILKKHGITSAIKTVEVVDMEALENALYNNEDSELITDIDSCRQTKEVVTLKVTTKKGK